MVASARFSRALVNPTIASMRSHGLHTSRMVRASHAPMSAEQTAEYPQQGFSSRMWGFILFAGVAGFVGMRVSSANKAKQGSSDAKPYLTELIESLQTSADQVREENKKHLDFSIQRAESQMLMQDAQKPSAHRFKFPAAFDQYPQRGVPVGSMVDTSNLEVNKERV
ncbi:mitochondrial protein [Malassezia pachydermatis]|uniref:Uncharacterized protein n=1 Tax=Malassezia pachydermatis TaxID=77020 RepID=A0A0N0RSL5_9BASI|nr:hypothetical protein Malapachy_2569 [Malassezia pachydermatis]KOS15579.1 hypothetical protein Malapachy_2569 [Malassezia pachydermatis]